MTRCIDVRRAILEILERAEPYALPERQLKIEINSALRPPVGDAEFDDALCFISRRGLAATVPDPLDEQNVKWTISEPGKALLRQ